MASVLAPTKHAPRPARTNRAVRGFGGVKEADDINAPRPGVGKNKAAIIGRWLVHGNQNRRGRVA